jgi:hypothetical protein
MVRKREREREREREKERERQTDKGPCVHAYLWLYTFFWEGRSPLSAGKVEDSKGELLSNSAK